MALRITDYHRVKMPKADQQGRRGLSPIFMWLGIAGRYAPQMKGQMAKAAALLGSYEEAVRMLAKRGIDISRQSTAGRLRRDGPNA